MGLFDGKVVVITGAGGGIGRCHALAFAAEGARVVVNDLGGSRDGTGETQQMADRVVQEIVEQGGEAIANYASVADAEGARSIVQTAVDQYGRIDVLVNNAGILRDKTMLKMTEEMWDVVIAVHLKGTFLCTQFAAEQMKTQGDGGRIINTSSYAGLKGNFGQANYGAAKAGIFGFTLVTAQELRSIRHYRQCHRPHGQNPHDRRHRHGALGDDSRTNLSDGAVSSFRAGCRPHRANLWAFTGSNCSSTRC